MKFDHGNLIADLMDARTIAHVMHLNTKSFSKHLALNDLYDSLAENTDRLAENFKGYLGGSFDIPLSSDKQKLNYSNELAFVQDLLQYLEEQRAAMQAAYDEFYASANEEPTMHVLVSPSALAIMDDLIESVASAVYKIGQLQ